MIGVPVSRGITGRHAERRPCRRCHHPGDTEVCGPPPDSRTDSRQVVPQPPEGAGPWLTPSLGRLAAKTVTGEISVVLSHPVCGDLFYNGLGSKKSDCFHDFKMKCLNAYSIQREVKKLKRPISCLSTENKTFIKVPHKL